MLYSKRLWQILGALPKPDKVYLDWQSVDHLYDQVGINIGINFNLCILKICGFLGDHITKVIVKVIYRSLCWLLGDFDRVVKVCQSLTVKIS